MRVSLGRSIGLYSDRGCDGQPRGRQATGKFTDKIREQDGGPGPPPYAPTWDGCDAWYVLKSEVDPTGAALFPRFTSGYVTDGVLVVDGDRTAPFFFGEARLDMREAKFVARIGRVGQTFQMRDLQIGGFVSLADAIRSIAIVSSGVGSTRICQVPAVYQVGIETLCAAADLPLELGRVGKGDTCAALSIGSTAEAVPVRPEISDRFIFDESAGRGDLVRDDKACPALP